MDATLVCDSVQARGLVVDAEKAHAMHGHLARQFRAVRTVASFERVVDRAPDTLRVTGMSRCSTPNSARVSTTALTTAPSAGVVPPSPPPRNPSGLDVEGTSLSSVTPLTAIVHLTRGSPVTPNAGSEAAEASNASLGPVHCVVRYLTLRSQKKAEVLRAVNIDNTDGVADEVSPP